ncbi:hypothetical protein EVAR_92626_1 [Eumeta japonica]|uniref:Uncharacterized protein n=1 Tax=Eumeta variegata TaxID=151549 RepID=A0A4C1SXI7_EUMVA|nr:hypothetical protein EVAR_92626_1 [Eumeta japonica]
MEGEWATGNRTHWMKRNSESCYFVSVFGDSMTKSSKRPRAGGGAVVGQNDSGTPASRRERSPLTRPPPASL